MVTLLKILSLAAVDAINPCALAVMAIVLVTLLMHDPKKKKNVLYGGLLFTLAVFIIYLVYGLVMVQFFSHIIPEVGRYSFYIFRGFGVFAIILGILNIKDYFFYTPGGFATEMPLKLRPGMKLLVKRITSPKGAFVVGMFVTLFLLPCTIGPYIIVSADISDLTFMSSLFWLLIYNIVFILPMIAITIAIYFGFTNVERVSGWKERNIRNLHLIEGLILSILGILMVSGVI